MGDNPATTPGGPGSAPGAQGGPAKPRSKAAGQVLKFVNDNFSNVFSGTHWVYTLCFFATALFIAILRFFEGSLLFALYAATSLVFTFLILLAVASIDAAAPLVLEGPNFKKLLVFILLFGGSFGLTALAFYGSEGFPEQYRLETSLPVIYMLIFFGWNVIQIFFIKKGFEDFSAKVEQKSFQGGSSVESKKDKGVLFLVLGLATPVAMLVGVVALLFFDATSSGYLLWNHPLGQVVLIAWMVAMALLLGAASFNAMVLFRLTVKHETPSVFSSVSHMLFLIYILFRSYQFINALGKAFDDPNQSMSWANDLLDACIMVLTLLLLFKGLGSKLSRASLFNKNNLPFMTFMFSSAVIMGNMVLVLGIQFGGSTLVLPQALVSSANGLMMTAVAVVYYFLYLKRALMQRDQLEKDTYSLHEVQRLFVEYTDTIAGRFAAEKAGLRTEMERFLMAHEIDVPEYTPGELRGITTGHAASSRPGRTHGGKAGFFDGIDRAESLDEATKPSPEQDGEDKPVESKYPLEQPKKVDDEGDKR
ncbi:MAG: hypothetical protein JW839_16730 [Candidatus Lokiarchaeota archaeon]|nr:hypothetical protein [Candidatus Lokiarchaeota archaeon]